MTEYSLQYKFLKGGAPPGPALMTNALSHHHRLSMPHIYALGAIVMAAAATNSQIHDAFNSLLLNYYGPNMGLGQNSLPNVEYGDNVIKVYYPDDNQVLRGILSRISWTDDNLFVGPAGKYRNDDPSQQNDKIPRSVGKWRFTDELISAFSLLNQPVPHVEGQGGKSFAVHLNERVMTQIVDKFLGVYPNPASPLIRSTLVQDWVAQVGNRCYPIFFPGARTRASIKNTRDLKSVKLKLYQNGDSVSQTQVFRIYYRTDAGDKSVLLGDFARYEQEHRNQGSMDIKTWMTGVPLK